MRTRTLEQSFYVYYGDAGDFGPVGGVQFAGTSAAYNVFGINPASWGTVYPYYRDGSGGETWLGIAVTVDNHWHEFKLAMDFSTEGGIATMYSRDVTAGETAFTKLADGTEPNHMPMYLSHDTQGRYEVDGFGFRMDVCEHSYVDNFALSNVPEPSASPC